MEASTHTHISRFVCMQLCTHVTICIRICICGVSSAHSFLYATRASPARPSSRSQNGRLPLHFAAWKQASDAVVSALLVAHPEAAKAKDNVSAARCARASSHPVAHRCAWLELPAACLPSPLHPPRPLAHRMTRRHWTTFPYLHAHACARIRAYEHTPTHLHSYTQRG